MNIRRLLANALTSADLAVKTGVVPRTFTPAPNCGTASKLNDRKARKR